ncbi:hypothetical protein RQP46_001864 [Phenoliferia psychrophenolica]
MSAPTATTVPTGSNPFDLRASALHHLLYGTPTKGFPIRVAFYLMLCAFGMLSCVVLLGLVQLDRCRQPTRERLWLFKRAKRGEGTWILTNLKLLVPIKLFIDLGAALIYTVIAYRVYDKLDSQPLLGGWRVGLTLPYLIGGWLVSYASLSSYLITRNSARHWLLNPMVVNSFFIGFGGCIILTHAINFAYLALLWTVRRQIGMKVRDLSWKSLGSKAGPTDTFMSQDSTSKPPGQQDRRKSVSRFVVRDMANSDGLASSLQQARDLQGLQRAEMDLATIAVSVIILGVGGLGVTMDIAILNGQREYFTQRWVILELALFTPVWGWAATTGLIVPIMILNTLCNLPRRRRLSTASSLAPGSMKSRFDSQGPATLHSIGKYSITVEQTVDIVDERAVEEEGRMPGVANMGSGRMKEPPAVVFEEREEPKSPEAKDYASWS